MPLPWGLPKAIEWTVKAPHMPSSERSEARRGLHVDLFFEVALEKGLVNVHGVDVKVEGSSQMKHEACSCLASCWCPCVDEVHPGVLGEAFDHKA